MAKYKLSLDRDGWILIDKDVDNGIITRGGEEFYKFLEELIADANRGASLEEPTMPDLDDGQNFTE